MRPTPTLALLATFLTACTFGDVDDGGTAASLAAPEGPGVADGATPVVVTVTGEPGRKVDLVVTGARFASADSDTATSVFLVGGEAEVEVVADAPGTATVFVAAAEVSTAVDLVFEPLRFAVAPAQPVGFGPGIVVHELCVASTSGSGTVVLSVTGPDEILPLEGAPLRATPPAGATCPDAADGPWRGYALFTWSTSTGDARADLEYLGLVAASARLDLSGVAFAGYQVTGTVIDQGSWVEVDIDITYAATGGLAGEPAAGVAIPRDSGLHLVPSDGAPAFFGSSSGGAFDNPRTDLNGRVTLYYDLEGAMLGTYTLFVTPQNGATYRITDPIEVP